MCGAVGMGSVRPTKLPDVCNYLGIDLRHHQADSDAEACAQIVIAAQAAGWCYGLSFLYS